jgi:hypothetical protein
MDDWEDIEFTEEDRKRMQAEFIEYMEYNEKYGLGRYARNFAKLVRNGCDEEWLATKWQELLPLLDRLEALTTSAYYPFLERVSRRGVEVGSWMNIKQKHRGKHIWAEDGHDYIGLVKDTPERIFYTFYWSVLSSGSDWGVDEDEVNFHCKELGLDFHDEFDTLEDGFNAAIDALNQSIYMAEEAIGKHPSKW